jgi:superfamily II DNA or RNA helicase
LDFFKEHYRRLSIVEGKGPNQGLRRGQVGALHALAAHFIGRRDPAIISLPTGYGKTAVMAGACFIAEASRVLIVVPTSALRSQTAKVFRSLDTLRRLNALPSADDLSSPVVEAVEERITSEDAWTSLSGADVVVVTPHSASPEVEGVVAPPADFFDLVFVDEGHHSPARTWAAFINRIPKAHHVLCSATPFRKDRLQLPGRLVFFYSLRNAVEERAFGRVSYAPVVVGDNAGREDRDAALVRKALEIVQRDREGGYDHRLMIRTGSIKDAERLAGLYVDAGLRVEAVSSRLSKKSVTDVEERLHAGSLDGVVCVDMFGEGYDFPKFKIAVLHVPHRSLVPTLQFIGRFARTNDERTGEATFLAIPGEVNAESDELYSEGVDWDVLLADVADARQQLTIRQRETLRAFKETAQPSADYEAVDAGQFRLPQHVAAYITGQAPIIPEAPETLRNLQIAKAWSHEDGSSHLFLTRDTKAPVWSQGDSIIDSRHDCFLLRHYADTRIVFITATLRTERYYSELIELFFGGNASPLPFERVRRVLNGLQSQEFFGVGLRNTSPTATSETYRIVAGSQADRGVRDTDAAHFCQGHFFGRGEVDGETEVIGGSSGGRIWSNSKVPIPELLEWMDTLHSRISSFVTNIGRSGLDKLPYGETLDRIPADTVTADWSRESYRDNPVVTWMEGGNLRRTCLLDLDISDIEVTDDGTSMSFRIGDEEQSRRFLYRLRQSPPYSALSDGPDVFIENKDGNREPFEDWLNDSPLTFYTAELDSFSSTTLNRRLSKAIFNIQSARSFDWTGCEIGVEFDHDDTERRTVQRHLIDHLRGLPDLEFIVYDHRSGEAADFIVGKTHRHGGLHVTLYHCKGAGGAPSGERVNDVYELAGQSVKSVRYQRKDMLLAHLDRRTRPTGRGKSSMFYQGTRETALDAIKRRAPIEIELFVVAVQPGLSLESLSEKVKAVMAAANDSVVSQQSNLDWMISP